MATLGGLLIKKSWFSFGFSFCLRYLCRPMKTIYFPDESICDGGYIATVGFFDGVHRGHQYLLECLQKEALQQGLPSMVITFERHPRQVVQQQWKPELLTTLEEKIALIRQTGIDVLVVLRFNQQMATLSAYDFMDSVLHQSLGVRCLLTGYDNRFGYNRAESFEDYCRYGRQLGMKVMDSNAFVVGTSNASSSRIRQLLKAGNVEEARQCLGRPYALSGRVVHGEQVGRKIGFPTANLQPDVKDQLVPGNGVYAVMVCVEGGCQKHGIMNIGTRPTFNGEKRTLETNILDEVGDIYGKKLRIEFIRRLRDERPFASGEALSGQIKRDKTQAEHILKDYEQES